MSEVKWTKEQQQAIYEKGNNILVAAAAGSGKTAVLVERIINKIINENVDIDKLLVVTFTNAAASEMRERVLEAIYKKLEKEPENQNLQRQIILLNKASICTIDAFCLDVIKNNFYEIDISPNFRIGDTAEIELLKQEVLEEVFEEKYEKEDSKFLKLIETYTGYRGDEPLKEIILEIFKFIQSSPFPEEWLEEKVEDFNIEKEEDFAKTKWGSLLFSDFKEEIQDGIITLKNAKAKLIRYPELEKFTQVLRQDIIELEEIQQIESWEEIYQKMQNFKFLKWPIDKKVTFEIKEEVKKQRDNVKKNINKANNKILICNSDEAISDLKEMYEILVNLKEVILDFTKAFSKKKKEKNMLDFNDIEHFALKILLKQNEEGIYEKTETAKKYEEKFEEIAIDEYQDSNLVQEYILNAISRGNNIFMVGDVKQSIYKFRQAMPELFLGKYEKYKNKEKKQKDEDLKIQLFKNFRSRENVLEITNLVFENIMSKNTGDIDYNEIEYLNLGANYPEYSKKEDRKVEINIIDITENEEFEVEEYKENDEEKKDQEQEEKIEDTMLEAKFVAKKIKELIESKHQIYDRKKETYRDIKYKDIVILLRATKVPAPIYEKEITNLQMPVFCDTSSEYLNSIEIQTIMSLLKIIDNPRQDIPLVTVLRSSIGGFTDNELAEIRLADKYVDFYEAMQKAKVQVDEKIRGKINKFLENLEKWRKQEEYLSLDELIWQIYLDTGYYNYVSLMPNGEFRQANLKMLFERAKQYEKASFKGLFNFINFIENLRNSSGDLGSAKLIGENEDVIRIMSIHKSKGLEFPVVFLCQTGKQFNMMDLNNNILLHQDLGIGPKYIDYEKKIEYSTLAKEAIRNKVKIETISEEMRVLYVALTRSKEKLYITGISKNTEKDLNKKQEQIEIYENNENDEKNIKKINPILIKKYKKYLDWIELVYLKNKEEIKDLVDFNIIEKDKLIKDLKTEEKEEFDFEEMIKKEKVEKEGIKTIEELLAWKYPYEKATKLESKASVTKIKQMMQEKEQKQCANQDKYEKQEKLEIREKIVQEEIQTIMPKPKFLNEKLKLTGAEKGTLIHECMQRLNPKEEYTYEKIKDLVNQMKAKEIITQNELENININKILAFTKSEIFKGLKTAKEIQREKPFYININADEIYQEDKTFYENEKGKNEREGVNKKEEKRKKQEKINEEILVQGIIDLYYIDKEGKLILVDYKTDYVENKDEKIIVQKYKHQLEIYKEALETALNKKVDKIYIYSTYLEKGVTWGRVPNDPAPEDPVQSDTFLKRGQLRPDPK